MVNFIPFFFYLIIKEGKHSEINNNNDLNTMKNWNNYYKI